MRFRQSRQRRVTSARPSRRQFRLTPLAYTTPPDPLGPRNRRTVLLVWGIVLIILGAACACLGAFTPLALLAPRAAGQPTAMPGGRAQVVMMLAMYVMLA